MIRHAPCPAKLAIQEADSDRVEANPARDRKVLTAHLVNDIKSDARCISCATPLQASG